MSWSETNRDNASQPTRKYPWSCFIYFCVIVAGCPAASVSDLDEFRRAKNIRKQAETADFDQAVAFLHELDKYDPTQIQRKILFHLQQWVEKQRPDPDWIADPLYHRLPKKYQKVASAESLSRLHFVHYDTIMLQEAVWLRDIARTVVQNEIMDDGELATWFEVLVGKTSYGHAERVEEVYRLFDWTVRNIQLVNERNRDVSDPSLDDQTAAAARFYVWESLILGRGPLLTKYRIFALLARQVDIPVVILSLGSKGKTTIESGRWLAAALVDDQLYLFDMRLGIPVPPPNGTGITTWAAIHDSQDDELADRYSLGRQDLQGVTVFVDGSPSYLAQRMKLVERQLTGSRKMVLTAQPSPLARRLRKRKGISSVQLWELPYACFLYRSKIAGRPDEMKQLIQRHKLFEGLTPLVRARHLHFRGVYDKGPDVEGAKSFYLSCRMPDAQIERLNQVRVEQMMKLKKGTLDDETLRTKAIHEAKRSARELKQNATFWLGLIAHEEGKYDVAISFLKDRILDKAGESRWRAAAIYNLGRSYEARGWRDGNREDFVRAHETYRLDEASSQRHGNRVRAERLDTLLSRDGFPPQVGDTSTATH